MLTVTREILELFVHDLWKDSRCLDVASNDGKTTIRRFADSGSMSIQEEYAFITRLREKSTLRIPAITQVNDEYLEFEYIEGTRAFNLLMDLRTLHRREKRSCYKDLGMQLLELLKQDLSFFQEAMKADSEFTQGCDIYPVTEKMAALYGILTAILPNTCPFVDIEDDLNRIADEFRQQALLPFRDATPKNVILNIPSLFQNRFASYEDRLKTVDDVCRSGELSRLLTRENIHHIDFSGCRFLCPEQDDWIALEEQEASAWLMSVKRPSDPRQGVSDLCTRFVRYSRFAGRKLAYRLLNHSGYRIRFKHDNEAGYFFSLSNTCHYLRMHEVIQSDRLSNLMNDLFQAVAITPDSDYLMEMFPVKKQQVYYSDIFPN